jgi:hypothetical protein
MYVPELICKSSEVYDRCDGSLLCGIQENNMVTVRRFYLAYIHTYIHTEWVRQIVPTIVDIAVV